MSGFHDWIMLRGKWRRRDGQKKELIAQWTPISGATYYVLRLSFDGKRIAGKDTGVAEYDFRPLM